jgi:alkylation response protein AidB-like acyl-CoA dehydrogenase
MNTPTYMTEERMMIKESAREFTDKEVLPIANELDPVKGDIPESLYKKIGEMGYFGIKIPEEYGGLGLGAFEYCLVVEELSRGWMSVGSLIARTNALLGYEQMSEEQKKDLLPKFATGELITAGALSEPNVGSDLSAVSCRATRAGDGWILNGAKYWCTYADQANLLYILARSEPVSDPKKKHRGLTMFQIPKERGEFPEGISAAPIPKIGYFGWRTYELAFDNFRLPANSVIGEEGKAFYAMGKGLETARAQTAARSIGQAQGALDVAIKYSQEREQFGVPIANFQAIRFKIATMATEVEAARQLMYYVCSQIDQGGRCDKEAAMVKYYASEMSERVTSEALQILGGAGYTTHFPVERYWRDARLTKIFEGTSEIQQRVISDHILGKVPS